MSAPYLALALVFALAVPTGLEARTKSELDLASRTRVTLVEAMKHAEQHTKGKAVEAEFVIRHNHSTFRVETLTDRAVTPMQINPRTGRVQSTGAAVPINQLSGERRFEVLKADEASLTLRQAATEAEHSVGGRAIRARVSRNGEGVRYIIDILLDGAVRTVNYDPQPVARPVR